MKTKYAIALCSVTFIFGLGIGKFSFSHSNNGISQKEFLPEKKSVITKYIEKQLILLPSFMQKDLQQAGIDTNNLTQQAWEKFLRLHFDKKIIDKLIPVSRNERSVMHLAAKAGNLELIEKLVDLGYDINKKDKNSITPLLLALENMPSDMKNFEVIKKMVDLGADLRVNEDDKYKIDAMKIVLKKANNEKMVQYLQEHGMSFSNKYLTQLSTNQNKKFLYEYMDSQEINPQYSHNKSVLERLININVNNGIISRVLEKNVDLQNDSFGYNALHAAASNDKLSFENIQKMVNSGIDINAQVQDARLTPLMLAVHNGKTDLVRLFLEHGARLDLQDRRGRDVYDILSSSVNIDAKKEEQIKKLLDRYKNR